MIRSIQTAVQKIVTAVLKKFLIENSDKEEKYGNVQTFFVNVNGVSYFGSECISRNKDTLCIDDEHAKFGII